jgi:spectinomycin phosphotransferase
MLEKPNIPDELIISRLQEEYDLRVYRLRTKDGTTYFLKLRKNFDEIIVYVPLFLNSQGIREIIVPFETKSKKGWADFGEYKIILYPFIEGKNGFQMELTDHHKRHFGSTLRAIHSIQLPPEFFSRTSRNNVVSRSQCCKADRVYKIQAE